MLTWHARETANSCRYFQCEGELEHQGTYCGAHLQRQQRTGSRSRERQNFLTSV